MSILPFEPKVPPIKHGQIYAYQALRCRCHECRAAQASYSKARREQLKVAVVDGVTTRLIAHGLSGYTNFFCRCTECRAANTKFANKYNAQLKEQYPNVKGR